MSANILHPRLRAASAVAARFAIAGALCACAARSPEPPAAAPSTVASTEPGEPAGPPGLVVEGERPTPADRPGYAYPETRALVALVDDAAQRIAREGRAALGELGTPGSRWQQGESYVFVLDPAGQMLVHADPAMVGRDQRGLRDVDGRPIIGGLLEAASADDARGWYHYRWPVPGEILPRWKSSYVRAVETPDGERLVVGSGVYDDRMERAHVVELVDAAAARVAAEGERAFARFRDRTGPFMAKDAYVFVLDPRGVELVNPAFPNLEGRDLLAVEDTHGKPLVREMLAVVIERGAGWVDYMWPKPGESVSTRKSTFVRRVEHDGSWLLVGAGVYLADAPKAAIAADAITAPELIALVRDAGRVVEERGDAAFDLFRRSGTRWFHGDTYLFAWTTDGRRVFHAADPSLEGQDASGATDVLGRPYGRMFLDVARSPRGEGWVHYMFPEPGSLFPTWKSTFLRRVTLPDGQAYLLGAGIYNMQMDRAFIEDVVDRAAARVAEKGRAAFAELRDPKGRFRFMDVYVFVDTLDGVELVNPAFPTLEGRSILDLEDAAGVPMVREYIAAAVRDGAAWVDYTWYRPGENTPVRKRAYVRLVDTGRERLVVGSGVYLPE